MALVNFYRDTSTKIASKAIEDGALYLATDTGELFFDASGKRIPIKTTYELFKVGDTIMLEGSDGTNTSVTDSNTTYSAMNGATASAAGSTGLVPAPAAGKQTSFLRGDGTWVIPTVTAPVMKGATEDAAGTAGSAPAPAAGAANRYLRSDGTWQVPPNTTYTLSSITGTLAVAKGGTGATTAAAARTNLGAAPSDIIAVQSGTPGSNCKLWIKV